MKIIWFILPVDLKNMVLREIRHSRHFEKKNFQIFFYMRWDMYDKNLWSNLIKIFFLLRKISKEATNIQPATVMLPLKFFFLKKRKGMKRKKGNSRKIPLGIHSRLFFLSRIAMVFSRQKSWVLFSQFFLLSKQRKWKGKRTGKNRKKREEKRKSFSWKKLEKVLRGWFS